MVAYFSYSTVDFLSPEVSDHCPTFVQMDQAPYSPLKPFKIFNFWTKLHVFQATIEKSWMKPMNGTPMVILQRKLKRLKQSLKSFNKDYFFDISLKVKAKKEELVVVQKAILSSNTRTDLVQLERNLT